MRFDLVLGNPPYQEIKDGNRISRTLWTEFAVLGAGLLREGGALAMIHPPGWRGLGPTFAAAKEAIGGLRIRWIRAVNGEREGRAVFGAATPFDAYAAFRGGPESPTEIETPAGSAMHRAGEWDFIPSSEFAVLRRIIAGPGDEAVRVVHDVSLYDERKGTASESRTGDFRLPCVRYVHRDGTMSLWWAREDRGHFGIPKVMFGIMANSGDVRVDAEGGYGLVRYMAAIHDEPENLERIAAAMRSARFGKVMEAVRFTTQEFNLSVIARLRRDFWREFVDGGGNPIPEAAP